MFCFSCYDNHRDLHVLTHSFPARLPSSLFAAYGGRVLALQLDVAEAAQAEAAIAVALDRFGRIDVLVNNAGYGQLGLFEENEPGEIERQFAINVFGTFHVTRAVLPDRKSTRLNSSH